ncbi:HET-domain-containing protein [Bimuria novae-zelandiae CBS 107.79]|uniref:HET-domain-containing protein n=1 Tax=Bimuria novae-zelandiae CBS 107.79 TaxID=1447943 RepID=A0A6A5UPK6_9PLEO|nr:HET-domain-containing protein [Bimuria novae-zelandiae CBS 107.79]
MRYATDDSRLPSLPDAAAFSWGRRALFRVVDEVFGRLTGGTKPPPACSICTQIAAFLKRTSISGPAELDIMRYETLRSNYECRTCRRLAEYIAQRIGGRNGFHGKVDAMKRYDPGSSFVTVGCEEKGNRLVFHFTLKLFRLHLFNALPFQGDPRCWEEYEATIDVISLLRAMSTCDANHAGTCHSMNEPWAKIESVPEIIVIDVEQQCLSVQPGSCKYVALSYVWGNTKTRQPGWASENLLHVDPSILQTTTSNFPQLCRAGAFRSPTGEFLLPATVHDSILITQKFCVKYLWVDRFCIIQDDADHKHAQIQAMAAIYTNSYFTIAACQSEHSDSGIHGVDRHRLRIDPYHRFEFSEDCRLIGPAKSMSLDPQNNAPYFKRGWTYQEWTLSKRILAFHGETASWICMKTCENEFGFDVSKYVGFNRLQNVFSPWPNIYTYSRAVQAYCGRQLTYTEDTLVAFSSVTNVMVRSMPGGILYGLPEMFFDGVLLWEPHTMGTLTRRRDATGSPLRQLPSWSFAGWDGKVTTSLWQIVYDYDLSANGVCTKRKRSSVYLTPLVDFYKVDEATHARVRIHNKFHVKSYNSSKPEEVSYEQLGDMFSFRSLEPPNLNNAKDSYSPIIEFRTQRLSVAVAGYQEDRGYSSRLLVRDQHLNPIGLLNPSEPESTLDRVELIRLSLGKTTLVHFWRSLPDAVRERKIYSCDEQEYDGEGNGSVLNWMYSFYFVLAIEWEDGIAYRKGLGWITQSFWDAAGAEEIDVRLG